MPRPRLLEPLQQARELRCVVITAPLGSGKTSILQTWARKASSGRTTFVWLNGGSPLARQLLLRCAEAEPELASVLPQDLPEDEETALAHIAIALTRAAGLIKRRLIVVFDDLQHLRDTSVLQGLQPLLDHAPPRLQCVFASRAQLPLSLGRLRSHGQLLEFDAADLAFTAAEAEALWQWQLGARVFSSARANLQGWHRASGGWATAVASIGRTAPEGLAHDALLRGACELLEAEVMTRLNQRQRRMLTRLSCVEIFDTSLAAQISGRPPAECASFLERFTDTGFLTHTSSGGVDGWRLHPTLGLYLQQQFAMLPSTLRRETHRIASNHLADRGRQCDAVRQAVAAADMQRAADLVEGWAGDLFKSGQHEALAELVRLVPPCASSQHPRLQLWNTLLALMEHRFVDCALMLAGLERDVRRGDRSTRRRMRVLQCWLAVFLDDMDAAAALLADSGASAAPSADEITLAAERNVVSWIHIYRNDYQRARDVQRNAEGNAIATPRGTLFGSLTGRCMAGLSHALEGRMDAAERTYREVLESCEANGATDPACIDAAVLATGLLGETLYELNDLRGVLGLEARLGELKQRSLPDTLLRVMLAICRAHALQGRTGDALRIAIELHAYAETRKLDRLMSYALLEQLRLHLLRHESVSADSAWKQIAGLRKAYENEESTTLSEVAVVADRAEILVHIYHGRSELARTRIAGLIDICRRRGRHRRVAALHFQHATMDRELGDLENAARHAREGLRLGAKLGLVRSLLDAHPDVPNLLADALAGNADTLLAFHADRLRAASGFGPLHASALSVMAAARLAPYSVVPAIALSTREEEIARLLSDALPNKEIARELGLSPETVKWHMRNIFVKLGVGTRYQALVVLRARSP